LDHGQAVAYLQKRMAAGDPEAYVYLGVSTYHGNIGLVKDEKKAMELWAEAARLGSPDGDYHIGLEYFKGWKGRPEMERKAREHFENAAKRGHNR